MEIKLSKNAPPVFEQIKKQDEHGNDFWSARDMAKVLEDAGVIVPYDYAIFQNHGYMGLYGGLDARGIHKRKGLKTKENILDHMGSTELAANLFRATQTEEKLKREQIKGKQKANQAHYEVGKKVRKTIEEIGGEMPENLPVAGSIKRLGKQVEKKKVDSKNKKENDHS